MLEGMNLDTVIVKSTATPDTKTTGSVVVEITSHAGQHLKMFLPTDRAPHPVSLLGRRLNEVVYAIYGPYFGHPLHCPCSNCEESDRNDEAYEAETERQYDAWTEALFGA